MTEKPKVKDTSKDYEHCIGHVEEDLKPSTLSNFLGLEDVPQDEKSAWEEHNYQNWREHWKGMPEFHSENKMPARQIVISFINDADAAAFGELIGQKITPKTKSIWYPKMEKSDLSLLRWIDEDAE